MLRTPTVLFAARVVATECTDGKPTAQPSGALRQSTTVADTNEAEIRENLAKLSAAARLSGRAAEVLRERDR